MKRQSNAAGEAYEPSLPDLGEAKYLSTLLNEAGIVGSTGMGVTGLTWQEIAAWLSATELLLTTWEKLMIFKMSSAYASSYSSSSDADSPEPFAKDVEEEIDREVVGNRIRNVLRSLMQK